MTVNRNNIPNIKYHPNAIDRMLEATALLIVIATWVFIFYAKPHIAGIPMGALYTAGVIAIIVFVIVGAVAYLPMRCINVPIRVTPENAAKQYVLALRFVRILNVILSLTMLASTLSVAYMWGLIALNVCVALMFVAIGIYIYIAIRNK